MMENHEKKRKCKEHTRKQDPAASARGIFAVISSAGEHIKNVHTFLQELVGVCGILSVIYIFFTKNFMRCELGIAVLAVVISWFYGKHVGKGIFAAALFTFVLFIVMSAVCMIAFGYLRFDPEPDKTDDDTVRTAEQGTDADDTQIEMEDVESTESPALTYVERTFEDKITSEIWTSCLVVVRDLEVTGTEENFEALYKGVWECLENCAWSGDPGAAGMIDSKKIRQNVDEIEKKEKEPDGWEKYTGISALRAENYIIYPSVENAHQSGIAALDCLDWMGKVNGKEKKRLNEDIYNEENLIKIGSLAVDGIFGWWMDEMRSGNLQNAQDVCFFFGQIFHHFGGCDEMTGDTLSIYHLVLSAVFYKRTVPEDEQFYKEGKASHQQYTACKYLAIVFDKLDNKLRPEDSFFVMEAGKYYTYSLYNVNLSTNEATRIKEYLKTVEEKKKHRGL